MSHSTKNIIIKKKPLKKGIPISQEVLQKMRGFIQKKLKNPPNSIEQAEKEVSKKLESLIKEETKCKRKNQE